MWSLRSLKSLARGRNIALVAVAIAAMAALTYLLIRLVRGGRRREGLDAEECQGRDKLLLVDGKDTKCINPDYCDTIKGVNQGGQCVCPAWANVWDTNKNRCMPGNAVPAAPAAAPNNCPGRMVLLYEDPNQRGNVARLRKGEYPKFASTNPFGDNVSSVDVPVGMKLFIYGKPDFQDYITSYDAGKFNLGKKSGLGGGNDWVQSVKVCCLKDGGKGCT